jgi:hypothetical protein
VVNVDSYPISSALLVRDTSLPARSRSTPAAGPGTGGTKIHGTGSSMDAAAGGDVRVAEGDMRELTAGAKVALRGLHNFNV